MAENEGGSNFLFFIAGVAIGGALALLFAPKSGTETRELIARKAGEGRDYVNNRSQELKRQAEGLVEKGKGFVAQRKEQLSAALDASIEAGKQAYMEEKAKQHS